ncbi:MAG: EAL domain-containing protein [Acholeplasmataceae bacterium]
MKKIDIKQTIEAWFDHKNILFVLFTAVLLPVVYLIVYFSGGTKFGFTHLMYIPIVLTGIFYSAKFAVLIAIIGGFMLGPIMPLDRLIGDQQPLFSWIFRTFMFVVIGGFIGVSSELLKSRNYIIRRLWSQNQETEIPNIRSLSIVNQKKYQASQLTMVTVIINNFQSIIDVFGVAVYYRFLSQTYEALKLSTPEDALIIQDDANKFQLFIIGDHIKTFVERIAEELNLPTEVDDVPFYVDYAIGASLIPKDNLFPSISKYNESDIAARFAQVNSQKYVIYDEKMIVQKQDFELLGTFSDALNAGEMYQLFQPVISLKDQSIQAIEALIRWEHPEKGLIMPNQFIPLVEATKLIHELTDWVIHQAAHRIIDLDKENMNLKISINVSANNLMNPDFAKRTLEIIDSHKISPDRIELEITESVLMKNPEQSQELLSLFKSKGIKISLDDFGIGYSSLSYLEKFPIDTIKIDRFFISQLTSNQVALEIIKSTISMAHNLGFKVVAEGIENKDTEAILKELECDYAQGYLFARPMHFSDIVKRYKNK